MSTVFATGVVETFFEEDLDLHVSFSNIQTPARQTNPVIVYMESLVIWSTDHTYPEIPPKIPVVMIKRYCRNLTNITMETANNDQITFEKTPTHS